MKTLQDRFFDDVRGRPRFPDLELIYKFEHLEAKDQRVIERVARGTRLLGSIWAK